MKWYIAVLLTGVSLVFGIFLIRLVEPMAYSYYAKITIDKDKVAADETDFPVLVSGTYDGTDSEPNIKSSANSGNVENTASGGASGSVTVPADLVFSPNTDGSSPYDFEIESYDASTGAIVAWVEIPSLSSSSDTEFYMVYGDSGVNTSQEDVNGTWGSNNFVGVWHLGEGNVAGTGNSDAYHDSTSNDNHGDDQVSDTGESGKIGKGVTFDGADDYIEVPAHASIDNIWSGGGTVSFWGYHTYANLTRFIAKDDSNGSNGNEWSIQTNTVELVLEAHAATMRGYWKPNVALPTGQWVLVHVVYNADDNSNDPTIYYNAADKGLLGADNNPTGDINDDSDENLFFGADVSGHNLTGSLDEIRFRNEEADSNWITTEYNNQNSPSTFYSMGNETSAGGAAAGFMTLQTKYWGM